MKEKLYCPFHLLHIFALKHPWTCFIHGHHVGALKFVGTVVTPSPISLSLSHTSPPRQDNEISRDNVNICQHHFTCLFCHRHHHHGWREGRRDHLQRREGGPLNQQADMRVFTMHGSHHTCYSYLPGNTQVDFINCTTGVAHFSTIHKDLRGFLI